MLLEWLLRAVPLTSQDRRPGFPIAAAELLLFVFYDQASYQFVTDSCIYAARLGFLSVWIAWKYGFAVMQHVAWLTWH